MNICSPLWQSAVDLLLIPFFLSQLWFFLLWFEPISHIALAFSGCFIIIFFVFIFGFAFFCRCRRDAFLNGVWFHAAMLWQFKWIFFVCLPLCEWVWVWPQFAYCFRSTIRLFFRKPIDTHSPVRIDEKDRWSHRIKENKRITKSILYLKIKREKKLDTASQQFFSFVRWLINRFEMVWWHFYNSVFFLPFYLKTTEICLRTFYLSKLYTLYHPHLYELLWSKWDALRNQIICLRMRSSFGCAAHFGFYSIFQTGNLFGWKYFKNCANLNEREKWTNNHKKRE